MTDKCIYHWKWHSYFIWCNWKRGTFCVGMFLYNLIRNKFSSLCKSVVLGSFRSFFQLNHQVDISLYLTEATALRHSREVVGLEPSWCTFNFISFFDALNFKINILSLHFTSWMEVGHTKLAPHTYASNKTLANPCLLRLVCWTQDSQTLGLTYILRIYSGDRPSLNVTFHEYIICNTYGILTHY